MKRIKNVQDTGFDTDLAELNKTNHLFVELLYNLSKYPHSELPKRFVRKGQFFFEAQNVFRTEKAKK